jgi:hypothetical protein
MNIQVKSVGFIQLGGWAAFGFAALILLANAITVPAGLPLPGASQEEVKTFYSTKSGIVAISSALTPLAWLFATVFGAAVLVVLQQSEQSRQEAWLLVGFAGLLLQNTTFAAIIATRLGLMITSSDSSEVAGLSALHDALFTLNGTFLAMALLGLSLAGIRGGLIHWWHSGLGLLSAALLLLSASLTPLIIRQAGPLGLLGLCGWLLWVLWIVVYGFTLVRFPGFPQNPD